MNFNEFLLDLNKKSCRVCLNSRECMLSLNGYDVQVNEHMTLLEILEFVTKTKCNFQGLIEHTAYICEDCKQKLINAYHFIDHSEKSESILEAVASENMCTSTDNDNFLAYMNIATEEYIVNSKEQENDHSISIENDEDLKLDESSSVSIEFYEEHLDETNDLLMNRHSTPIFEIMDTCNKRELDSDKPEETVCDLMLLKQDVEPLCEMTSITIEDSKIPELTDDFSFQEPVEKPSITPSSLQTRSPMSEMMKISSNTNALPFCKYCSRNFTTNAALKSHINSFHYDISRQGGDTINETKDPDFPCKYCPRLFKREYTLRRHLKAYHPDQATILEIEGGYTIGNKKKIPKSGLCPYCGRSFVMTSLKVHIRRHTGENPYKCNVCEKSYPRLQDLKAHSRNHTGEKPFPCVICKKSFSLESKLSRHMYLHLNRNRLTCDFCEKGFINSGDLKIHKRRHTGELPYNCTACQGRFICASSLNRHRCPGDASQTKENKQPTNN